MDSQLAHIIGAAARAARSRLGLSQADAAERCGISTEFYARIERGGTFPSVPTLLSIAEALDVSADVLLGRTQPRRKPAPAQPEPRDGDLRRLLRRAREADPASVRLLSLVAAALVARSPR